MLNKLKKILFVIPLVLVCAMWGCATNSESSGSIVATDLAGRAVKLDAPATRVAALSASDCEILYAIGAGDTIIARGTYCDYPEAVKSVSDLGSGELTNIEELISLKPDVVFMCKTGFTLEQVNTMEAAGLKTCVNEANTFSDTYQYIKILGTLTGHDKEASELVANMSQRVDEYNQITKDIGDENKKSVYFQIGLPQHGYWTAGKNTFMDEMCSILNLNNIFNDVEGWAEVSQEQITLRNPDITVVIDEDTSFTRPGPRLVDALDTLYKKAYENN